MSYQPPNQAPRPGQPGGYGGVPPQNQQSALPNQPQQQQFGAPRGYPPQQQVQQQQPNNPNYPRGQPMNNLSNQMAGMSMGNRPQSAPMQPPQAGPRPGFSQQSAPRPGGPMPSQQQQQPFPVSRPGTSGHSQPQQATQPRPMTPGQQPRPIGQGQPRPMSSVPQQQPPRPGMVQQQQPPRPGMPTSQPQQQQPPRPGMMPPQPQQQQPPRPGMPTSQQQQPMSMQQTPTRPGMPNQPQMVPQQGPPRPGMSQQGPPRPGMTPQQMQHQGPPMPGQQMQQQAPPMPGQQMQQQGPPLPGQQMQHPCPPMPGMQGPPMSGMQGPPMSGMQGPPRPGMPGQQITQGPPMAGMGTPAQQFNGPPRPGMALSGSSGPGMQNGMQQQQPAGMPPARDSTLDNPESQCDPCWMQTCFGKFPASEALKKQSAIPLGVVIQPLAEHPKGKEVPVVNFGATVIRCRACRAYINPFVQWTDNGRRWRCNLCGRDNETGSAYYSHLDGSGQRADRLERAELHEGCIEILAPQEYMIRPPQAPVYVFVLDVSYEAVSSGMLACAVQAIKKNLDTLPGSPRTQVALLTFDYAVHFYGLSKNLTQPKMFVVSDLDDLFLPCPEDLLVNLSEARDVFEMLLDSLPRIHGKSSTHDIASGAAMQAAYRIMVHIGGKMLVFQTKLPSLGQMSLTNRDNPKLMGTDKEHTLLDAANVAYKNNVTEMCKNQVSVDLFLFPNGYCDVATLQTFPKYSGGQLHYYPRFNAQIHGNALMADIERTLTRETAWEAVFRLRASNGVRVSGFYGNFQLRGADLLQVPVCDADSTYGLELSHVDNMVNSPYVTLQGALLYTNSNGERRIRVMTSVYPVATILSDVHQSANQEAIFSYIAKKASDEATKIGLTHIRNKILNFSVNVVRASRLSSSSVPRGVPNQMYQQQHQQGLPQSLSLVPLYAMALQKNPAFRGGMDIPTDDRCYYLHLLGRISPHTTLLNIYPRMYEIDNMPPDAGRLVAIPAGQDPNAQEPGMLSLGSNQRLKLPSSLNLSSGNLRSNGIYLVNNGISFLMWIGRGVDPRILQSLFGISSLDNIDAGVLRLDRQSGDADLKQRVCNIIDALRAEFPGGSFQQIRFFKEGDSMEYLFRFALVEDRANFNGGSFMYDEYMNHITRLASTNAGADMNYGS